MLQKIRTTRELGGNLRRIRKEKGFTQEQVVAKLQLMDIDISRSAYAQIECGTYNIRVIELVALKEIFCVSYDDIFNGLRSSSSKL